MQLTEALPLLTGRSAKVVMAERGYDSNAIVEAMGAVAVITSQALRRPHDRVLYKLRNRIERCFSRQK